MAFIDYEQRQIHCKVVYFGPEGAGKTAMIEHIYRSTNSRGERVRPANPSGDAHYDYLPLQLGQIRGFTTQFGLYTVPGRAGYSEFRRELLKKVDGIVFVADARPEAQAANGSILAELKESLRAIGFAMHAIPFVFACTHTDQPGALTAQQVVEGLLRAQPELAGTAAFSVAATQGQGVFESLKGISRLILMELRRGG